MRNLFANLKWIQWNLSISVWQLIGSTNYNLFHQSNWILVEKRRFNWTKLIRDRRTYERFGQITERFHRSRVRCLILRVFAARLRCWSSEKVGWQRRVQTPTSPIANHRTMSILLNPVSVEVCDSFYPLSNTTATSLVDQLPLGSRATGLLLSGCDPRKILYTIYSEQENGQHFQCNADM